MSEEEQAPSFRQQEECLEREFREEVEARQREDALEIANEMASRRRDEDFIAALEAKFPTLLGWPGKDKK